MQAKSCNRRNVAQSRRYSEEMRKRALDYKWHPGRINDNIKALWSNGLKLFGLSAAGQSDVSGAKALRQAHARRLLDHHRDIRRAPALQRLQKQQPHRTAAED